MLRTSAASLRRPDIARMYRVERNHLAVAARERFRVLQRLERQFHVAQALMSPGGRAVALAKAGTTSLNNRSLRPNAFTNVLGTLVPIGSHAQEEAYEHHV